MESVTRQTRTWVFGEWDLVILEVLHTWDGDRIFRRSLHRRVSSLIKDPIAHQQAGKPGSSTRRSNSARTSLDRRVINILIMLERAGLIDRDDVFIRVKDRVGVRLCLDAGKITYSWEKEDHVH